MQGSKSFGMPSKDEWVQLGFSAVKVGVAAAATYALQTLSQHDWGEYKIYVMGGITLAFEFLHRWAPDTRTPDQKK